MRKEIGGMCPLLSGRDRKGNVQAVPCQGEACEWYIKLRGKDPQSENEIDEYGCAIAWLPTLLIENAQQSRQTGAAVESFRNEMAGQQKRSVELLGQMLGAPRSSETGTPKAVGYDDDVHGGNN